VTRHVPPRSPAPPDLLLHIVARGRIGRGPEAELVERYLGRIAWPTRVSELPDRGGRLPSSLAPSRTVVLDETGQSLGAVAFAERLGGWRDDGVRETRFLLGAADGFDDATRAQADLLLSFGRTTWPHLLARAMLAEQLFRATSILAGHPYHREG
jgi:23S rRNA (pseudouridine1915-N3)-methyltransferase